MITTSPCGIILKLIYLFQKRNNKSINGNDLLYIINKIQQENSSIYIYNIQPPSNDEKELISFNYWNDLSTLENSGNVNIHHSEPLISITFTGSLSADTIEIPKDIETNFYKYLDLI